jgi:hypothetical protein|tara:strand:- start:132 stop:527 length:396 start_codon:yes stop_codon:yes gene_type:complete
MPLPDKIILKKIHTKKCNNSEKHQKLNIFVFSMPFVSFRSDKKGKINITIKSNAHKHIFAERTSVRMFFCAPEIKVATKLTGSNALINKRTLKIVFFIREYFIDRMILLTVKNTGTVKNTTEIKTSIFMPF